MHEFSEQLDDQFKGSLNRLRALLNIIITLVSAYLVLLVVVYFFQSRLLFFPSKEMVANPSDIGLHYDEIDFVTEDRVSLRGWYVPVQQAKGVVLFFHGNAGNISHRLETLRLLNQLQLTTLIFDYRGFGESEGSVSEQGVYKDAAAALDYLTSVRRIPAGEIIYFGRSLGSAIATQLASQDTPKALIVESGFSSVPDMAAQIYPFLPVRFLSRFDFDTVRIIKSVRCPILIVHSPEDEIIPFEHGLAVYESANQPKQFLQISGGHNDGFLTSGELYRVSIERFVIGLD